VPAVTAGLNARWGLVAAALAGAAYVAIGRPWQLSWGATPEEVARPLSCDDLVPRPTFNATRAISITATPESIWPWLVQVGVTRAGWYSYDLLDNLGRPSARRIVPEWQHLAPGDIVAMSPDGLHGIGVHSMDAPHTMVWYAPGETSWVWQLDATPGGTRLITRVRSRPRRSLVSIASAVLTEVADIWMIRKMLLNLRDRAEDRAVSL
jgi:hypothetical protein